MTVVYERCEIGPCPLCPREDWLFHNSETQEALCAICFLNNIRGNSMSPDDLSGRRELRFKHGRYHVIINASIDGTGSVIVTDDFHEKPDPAIAKEAVKDAVRMLSIARRIAWDEFVALGGTAEELRSGDDAADER